jgi:hypothetical protein
MQFVRFYVSEPYYEDLMPVLLLLHIAAAIAAALVAIAAREEHRWVWRRLALFALAAIVFEFGAPLTRAVVEDLRNLDAETTADHTIGRRY